MRCRPFIAPLASALTPGLLRRAIRAASGSGQLSRGHYSFKPVGQVLATSDNYTTLLPGDLILTGTPPGVGLATGRFLESGNEVEVEVEINGIGKLRNEFVGGAPETSLTVARASVGPA